MTLCPWLHDACSSYWRLAVSLFTPEKSNQRSTAETAAATDEAIDECDEVFLRSSGNNQQQQQQLSLMARQEPTRFVRTKFSRRSSQQGQRQHRRTFEHPHQHQDRRRKPMCLGGLRHSDSRTSDGGPIYRYVSSLSLELREAKANAFYYFAGGSNTRGVDDGDSADNDDDEDNDDGISLASSEPIDALWPASARLAADVSMSPDEVDGAPAAAELVATQLLERLADNDLAGAIRHCRLLLTFQPQSGEARELLAALSERDRQQRDDLLDSDSESTDTESETYFRYFHHDQHGRNEDEAESRRTSSGEPDHFLDASSSSD